MAETKVVQTTVKDWNHFISFIKALDVGMPPPTLIYICRGTSREEYELTPSFHRYFKSLKTKSEILLKIETTVMEEFRSQAHLHISEYIVSKTVSSLDWWSLMQHYHAPTRLLDWTRSPYIASQGVKSANGLTANLYIFCY